MQNIEIVKMLVYAFLFTSLVDLITVLILIKKVKKIQEDFDYINQFIYKK